MCIHTRGNFDVCICKYMNLYTRRLSYLHFVMIFLFGNRYGKQSVYSITFICVGYMSSLFSATLSLYFYFSALHTTHPHILCIVCSAIIFISFLSFSICFFQLRCRQHELANRWKLAKLLIYPHFVFIPIRFITISSDQRI